MAFGILDDSMLDNVPGTQLLSDRGRVDSATMNDSARELKRGTGKYSHIILIPQPSDDPCDPLNWPRWKKEACFWTLVFVSCLALSLPGIAGAAYVVLAKQFKTTVDDVTSSFGSYAPALAISLLLQNALAVKYGQRIIYLVSTFLVFVTCIWTALSVDLMSVRLSRIFQGFGIAPAQCLVAATIERIYFVHERGFRSIIWNFSALGGTTLGPLIYGYVVQDLSWQLGFWFISIACGLAFLCVFFFVPETTRRRQEPAKPSVYNEDTHAAIHDHGMVKKGPQVEAAPEGHTDVDVPTRQMGAPSSLSHLKIYNGTFSDEGLWMIFMRPFVLILSPVTWFIFFACSLPMLFQNALSLSTSTIFTLAYGFNAAQIGLTHLGGFVGSTLAMLVNGPLSDRAIVWMSQRNRGVYEPEYRLVFMLSMLFGVFGYIGWAVGNAHHMPWIGAVACFAMILFSLIASIGAATAYLLDTHGADALHVLSLVHSVNDLLFYGATFFVNRVFVAHGFTASLLVLGTCQAVCCLACVPMYVYGKRVRSYIARHPRLSSSPGKAGVSESTSDCLQSRSATAVPRPDSKRQPE